jgi:CO dehydrogenase maturation factor
MKRLVSAGRGGSGKSTFMTLVAKFLIETGQTPLLLVDVDPDQNLGEMVGVDLKTHGKQTISELLLETFIETGGTTVGVPPSERIESRIWEKGLYEGASFDFMSVGTKFVEGCYCLPDAALKKALESLTKTYRHVLVDSPAGLEHLNRRVTSQVDDIFDVIDPSQKAFSHLDRAYNVAREVKIDFQNFYVVAGYRVPETLEAEIARRVNLPYVGKIAYDPQVEEYVLSGRPLLELPSSSPAYVSVQRIMAKAGYSPAP